MPLKSTDVPVVIICVVSILLGLLLTHHAWIYHQLVRVSTPSLQGRYSRVVLKIIALGAAYFLIYQPFLAICDIVACQTNTYIIPNLLVQITATIYPFLISYRSWMIYYKIQWHIAMEDTQWSKFIDTDSDQNWFMQHRQFNKKYTSKIFFSVWLTLELSAAILTFLGDSQSNLLSMVYGVQYFGPVLFLAFLLCKTPKYDDIFFIRDEIRLIVIATLAASVLYVPAIMLPFLLPNAGHILLRIYTLIGPFCILYPHLYFPFKTFHLPQSFCALKQYRDELSIQLVTQNMTTNTTPSTPIESEDKQRKRAPEKLRLRGTLATTDGFNAFARHMNKEFAVEGILFLLEIYQFKQRMLEIFGKEEIQTQTSDTEDDVFSVVHFPQNLPRSTMICNMHRDNAFLCSAELFVKYIVEDAYFAINIAYCPRLDLYEAFKYDKKQEQTTEILAANLQQSVTEWKALCHLFDTSVFEVYRSLKGAFSRFEQTAAYQRLLGLQKTGSNTPR